MARLIVVNAADGYRVVFSLEQLDPALGNRDVFLCDARDGASIPEPAGPFRLVVPSNKCEARRVRDVTSIDIEDAP